MPGIPEEYRALAARLTTAEGQIFPLVMVDPERYQRAVTLIGLLSEYFTERAASLAELAGARADAAADEPVFPGTIRARRGDAWRAAGGRTDAGAGLLAGDAGGRDAWRKPAILWTK